MLLLTNAEIANWLEENLLEGGAKMSVLQTRKAISDYSVCQAMEKVREFLAWRLARCWTPMTIEVFDAWVSQELEEG